MAQFDDIDYSYLGVDDLKGDRQVRVSNVARRKVHYVLPELNNTTRTFAPATPGANLDTKLVTFHELYLLHNSPGGQKVIFENLQIKDNDVRIALGLPTDPEFDYSIEDIKKIMNSGTKEEILDALDFGPAYIAQWMKGALVTENVKLDYDKIKFFETLFRMSLDNLKSNFEWAKEDPQIGREYRAMETNNEAVTRQRRAGANSVGDVETAAQERTRRVAPPNN